MGVANTLVHQSNKPVRVFRQQKVRSLRFGVRQKCLKRQELRQGRRGLLRASPDKAHDLDRQQSCRILSHAKRSETCAVSFGLKLDTFSVKVCLSEPIEFDPITSIHNISKVWSNGKAHRPPPGSERWQPIQRAINRALSKTRRGAAVRCSEWLCETHRPTLWNPETLILKAHSAGA